MYILSPHCTMKTSLPFTHCLKTTIILSLYQAQIITVNDNTILQHSNPLKTHSVSESRVSFKSPGAHLFFGTQVALHADWWLKASA